MTRYGLDGKTAIVTGGARGIGRAICVGLARAGFDIGCVSREPAADARQTIEAVRAAGRECLYVEADIADTSRHADLVRAVTAVLGTPHCLVNNAGVTSLARGDLLELGEASFDRTLAVNLRGTFFLTQCVARAMIADRGAAADLFRSIITITSANAEIVGADRGDYCISKAGMAMGSKLFADRLARESIRVFEVRPGIIRTDMTAAAAAKYDRLIAEGGVPVARWGTPEDVAATVVTLALGGLAFATGEVINVGGGLHLHRV
ncbi:MAG TPA: 3-ketoacyl-ACP reductase [Casimicrobiaceae bacterium]|nr:3-ketoacyl-ACP reductase [Casimicrobiaceae bacterium]